MKNLKQLLLLISIIAPLYADAPRLLIKIPTRSRPTKCFQALDAHYERLSGEVPYHFLITLDADDPVMNKPEVIETLKKYPHLTFSFSINTTKVAAYNRDLHRDLPFDILLLSSDDMIPCVDGFDKIIVDMMLETFPDFDGVLNFHDGVVGGVLNTYPIIGKKFFDRFGYAYYPGYSSLFCDEELTLISRMLGKEKISEKIIIRHMHPSHGLTKWDDLYVRNEGFHHVDGDLFRAR